MEKHIKYYFESGKLRGFSSGRTMEEAFVKLIRHKKYPSLGHLARVKMLSKNSKKRGPKWIWRYFNYMPFLKTHCILFEE